MVCNPVPVPKFKAINVKTLVGTIPAPAPALDNTEDTPDDDLLLMSHPFVFLDAIMTPVWSSLANVGVFVAVLLLYASNLIVVDDAEDRMSSLVPS